MRFPFSRWDEPDLGRTRMPAERKFIPAPRTVRAPGEPARDQPWWKEMLGIGTKREWVLIGIILFLFFASTSERQGTGQALWGAVTATAGLLFARWWSSRQERESDEARRPVLEPGECEREEPGTRG